MRDNVPPTATVGGYTEDTMKVWPYALRIYYMKKNFYFALTLWICLTGDLIARAENRWAVVIGISTYQNPRANLEYTVEDARAMYDILITNSYFSKQNIRLLLNDQATKANITQVLGEWLPTHVASGDLVMIYYSGHGFNGYGFDPKDEAEGQGKYLAPYDIDISSFDRACQTGVRTNEIAKWLGKLLSDNIVIFDSCYSGGGIKSVFAPGTPKSLDYLLPRREGTKSLPAETMREDLAGLTKNITFLAACLSTQRAWEDPDLKQSVFTYYLVKGLKGDADLDGDGAISISEAFTYTQRQIANNPKWGPIQQPEIKLRKDLVLVSFTPPTQIAAEVLTPTPISIPTATPTPPITPAVRIKLTPTPLPPVVPIKLPPTPNSPPILPAQIGKIKVDLWFDILQADGTVKPGIENENYRSGETLKLSFRAAQDCYLFVFNIDQKGNIHHIYPSDPQADESVRVEGNQIHRIRGTLDNIVGEERFYAVASEQPFSLSQDVLPEVYREFHTKNLQVGEMKDLKIPLSYATISLKHR